MDTANAAPSEGSVPAPSSSIRIKEFRSACSVISTILFMWEEKVERLCSMLCSSPISAKIFCITGSVVPGPAGIGIPAWFIRISSPAVFKATVFPPVFGPVITKVLYVLPAWISNGTTFSGSIKGCRPWRISITPALFISADKQSYSTDIAALAKIKSNLDKYFWLRIKSRALRPVSAESSFKILRISSLSCASSSLIVLLMSTTTCGSIKRVAPDAEVSWTIPGKLDRYSWRTGMTGLPSRMVMTESWSIFWLLWEVIIAVTLSRASWRCRTRFLRMFLRAGLAESAISSALRMLCWILSASEGASVKKSVNSWSNGISGNAPSRRYCRTPSDTRKLDATSRSSCISRILPFSA